MLGKKYILLPDGSPDILIEQIKTLKAPMFKRLYEQCDYYSTVQLPTEHPTSNITSIGYAVANLSLIYLITKQKHYLLEVKRWISTAINYEHWGKATLVDNGLDAGWLLFGLSLSYNWIGDCLEDDERNSLKEKLILQGSRLYKYAVDNEGKYWSSVYWQSHNWICHTALYTVGYALREEHPASQQWIDKAKTNFDIVLSVLSEDGSFFTGMRFWRYSIPWLITYMDMATQLEGVDLFKSSPFMRNTFYFSLYQTAPSLEEIINFGDCSNRRSGHSIAVYYKLASEYKIGHAQWLANQVSERFLWKEEYESEIGQELLSEAFLELLWFDDSVISEQPDNLPLVKYFDDLGLVVIRTSWDENSTLFSFKASPAGGHKAWRIYHNALKEKGWMVNIASHQHPDNNSFILFSHGSYLAIDDGLVNSKFARHHNTVIVDNKGYTNDGKYDVYYNLPFEAQANIEEFLHQDNYIYILGESSKLYSSELCLKNFNRGVLYTGNGYFIIMDELDSQIPHTYTWLLHSDHLIEDIGNNTFKTSKGNADLYVHCVEPQSLISKFEDVKINLIPMSTTPNLVLKRTQKVLSLENSEPVTKIQFLTVLRPKSLFCETKANTISVENDSCIGIIIEEDSKKEIFLWARIDSANILFENICSDSKWVSLQFDGENIIRYGMHQGTHLIYNGTSLVSLENKGNVFEDFSFS